MQEGQEQDNQGRMSSIMEASRAGRLRMQSSMSRKQNGVRRPTIHAKGQAEQSAQARVTGYTAPTADYTETT